MRIDHVASSFILALSYHEDDEVAVVWIKDRGPYEYSGVSKEEYEAFLKSASKGTFFNDQIKPAHPAS